jgi:hypothetical protein
VFQLMEAGGGGMLGWSVSVCATVDLDNSVISLYSLLFLSENLMVMFKGMF